MEYTNKPKPETREVREPVAPYCVGTGGSAVAGIDEADWDDDEDFGAPESVTVHSCEELWQKLEEGRIAHEAGLVRPIEDFWRDFKRKVENGEL